ncbi:MAG: hypothetical protein JWP89_1724 [Schlesneria sp.]|nr:hypothetical protein [Schlesneria sp.]
MEGYLFDTNAVSHWYSGNAQFTQRVNALASNDQIRVSVITLGELEFGHNLHLGARDLVQRDEFARWVSREFPKERVVEVTRFTREYYGLIRAKIFEKYPPLGHDENHPERCYDRITASELKIDENDLWIAAQAIEHGLILVTNDKMQPIKEVAHQSGDWELRYEDWTL